MVRNFDFLITKSKSNPSKVLKDVKNHLLNQPYNEQLEGLTNAILKHTPMEINKENVKRLVQLAINRTEKSYEDIFKENSNLFKTKSK